MPITPQRIRVKFTEQSGEGLSKVDGDLSYRPYYVQYIETATISSVSDLNSVLINGERAIVVNQPEGGVTEGLYSKTAGTVSLQSLSDTTVNWCFIDIKTSNRKRAVFISSLGEYRSVNFSKFLLEYNFSTTAADTTAQDLFEIPALKNRFCFLKIKVFGVLDSDTSKHFFGEYDRYFYNDNYTFNDSGNMGKTIFNKDVASLPSPTIAFDNTGNAPKSTLTIGSGSAAVDWHCKGELVL